MWSHDPNNRYWCRGSHSNDWLRTWLWRTRNWIQRQLFNNTILQYIASSIFSTRCWWLNLELGNQQGYQVGPWVPQKVISTKERAPCANPNVSKVQGGSQGLGKAEGRGSHTAKRKWECKGRTERWTRPSITKWPSVPVPHLGVCTLTSNNVTQNRLISRGGIQCIPGMGMWRLAGQRQRTLWKWATHPRLLVLRGFME